MAMKQQTGSSFLKTHSAEEIAKVMASGHPPFHADVKCDEVNCEACWLAWLKTGKPPEK